MSNRQMKKKRHRKHSVPKRGLDGSALTLLSYDIIFEPITDELGRDVDPELEKEKEEIYFDTRKNPKGCIPRLLLLIEKYPHDPVLYNYLTVAYKLSGQNRKADDVTLEAYRKFPDYLFAKLAYADLCMEEGNLDEIPRILDEKYDLKLQYPERTKFHISEYTAFSGTVGFYFCRIGKPEVAKLYYKSLKEIAPDDPQTKKLEKALEISATLGVMKKIKELLNR